MRQTHLAWTLALTALTLPTLAFAGADIGVYFGGPPPLYSPPPPVYYAPPPPPPVYYQPYQPPPVSYYGPPPAYVYGGYGYRGDWDHRRGDDEGWRYRHDWRGDRDERGYDRGNHGEWRGGRD